MRSLALCLALLAAIPAPARAGEGGATDVEKAKELFVQGVAEFKEGKHAKALESFKQSFEIRPHWRLHLNMGLCYKELSMFSEARAELDEFLEQGEGQIDEAELKLVEDAIRDLEGITAVLEIEISTDGAVIEIDGKDVTEKALSGKIVVDPGAHVIEASLDGFEPATEEILVSKGETRTLTIDLEPLATGEGVEPAQAPEKEDGPAVAEPRSKSPVAFWLMASLTVALAAGSVATGAAALGKKGQVEDLDRRTGKKFDSDGFTTASYEEYLDDRKPLVETGKALGYATTVLMAAAGAALVGTIVAGVVTKPFARPEQAISLAPVPVTGGGVIVASGCF